MTTDTNNPFEGFEMIYSYSRTQALADGVLMEMKEAQRFGFKLQVVCTDRVWRSLIGNTDPAQRTIKEVVGESLILRAAYLAAKTKMAMERAGVADALPDRLDFHVLIEEDGEGPRDVQLYMLIHPDDDGSMKPVATIMYPDKD